MPKKSSRAVKSGVKSPRAAMEPATTAPSLGIRSTGPTFSTFDGRLSHSPGRRKERVRISRGLCEELPFVDYINAQLAEEAVGDGMYVSSDSKNEEFRLKSTELFDLWGSSTAIDPRRRFNIYTCQAMLGATFHRDGEVFVLKVKDSRPETLEWALEDKSRRRLQLQFFTTDQIGAAGETKPGERWNDGIKLNAFDAATVYRFLQRGAGSRPKFKDVEAEYVIHLFMDNRLNQIRGVPAIFSGEKSALDALDLRKIEKHANKIRATFLGAITTPNGDIPASMKSSARAGQKTNGEGQQVDNGLRYLEIAGGVVLPVLRQGEEITFFTGQQGLTFGEFLATLMCEMGYAFKCPPEYLWKYAGLGSAVTRMVLRKVTKCLNRIRRPIREHFLQQVWEFVIGDAIETGVLPPVPDWNQIRVKGGSDVSIDAGRDEKQEQERLRTFTGTVEAYADGLGLDGVKLRHGRLDEIADNIRYGRKKHGLPWFLCIDPAQVQAVTGLAAAMKIDVEELVKEITKERD